MANEIISSKEHPLAGVVLCFTSILPEQRTDMATVASQMGAIHKFDLTSDVTHLLVGEVSTPKYKFVARERADVVVLRPEWIEAVRQSWIQGEDADIRALEDQYKLPTFAGLSICITGFEDMDFRNHMQATVTANGAEFKKDLTKSVTHLVARSAEGQKYKFATQWNIKVVSVKWFTDSIDRGMILEETLYHPLCPENQQGTGAWNRDLPAVAKDKLQKTESSLNPRPRKLRRVASAKLGGQNEGIWGDIVGSGFDSSDLKPTKTVNSVHPRATSVIQEAKSFASESTFAEAQESHGQSAEVAAKNRGGFLRGCCFFIHGFSHKQRVILRTHLLFNGAQLVDSLNEFSRRDIPETGHDLYIIVSYRTPRSKIPSTDDLTFECEVVTDMWLERCLDAKSLVPPISHIASTPIPKFPVSEFCGMKICSTGFSRIDLLHLSKLADLMGASYNEYLTPNASVLICNDPNSINSEKLRHTCEWSVPIVTADWLWTSIRTAQKKPFEPYIIQAPLSSSAGEGKTRRPMPQAEQGEGFIVKSHYYGDVLPAGRGEANKNEKTGTIPPKDSSGRDESEQMSYFFERQDEAQEVGALTRGLRTPSPTKPQPGPGEALLTLQGQGQSAFDQTVSGFLQQVRAARSHPTSENGEKSDLLVNGRQRRRKPLTGKGLVAPSRASSIDTINEDGCGSAIESTVIDGDGDSSRPPTRASSRNGRTNSFNSILNDSRFEISQHHQYGVVNDEEDRTPVMTQLHYEDPDAVAMREQFLSYAGKLVDKRVTQRNGGPTVGEVRELEDVSWSTGRRTRNAGKSLEK